MATYKVVMVRHGESAWNKENRFCGWYDADLAETGVEEAKNAGKVWAFFDSCQILTLCSVIVNVIKMLERLTCLKPYRKHS